MKHVFDWLKKPEVPKYQPASIRAIYALKSQFNDEEDKEFLQFIFEELIQRLQTIKVLILDLAYWLASRPNTRKKTKL